jgi:hypothetical protein
MEGESRQHDASGTHGASNLRKKRVKRKKKDEKKSNYLVTTDQ